METPLSTRRVTRSKTLAAVADHSNNNKNNIEVSKSENTATKSRQMSNKKGQDRSAFMDITNDSPIVGLAMGSLKTPSSTMSKKRINCQAKITRTPGSGEALLRGQVKSLLQKVEEEAELSKITLQQKPFFNLVNSPIGLLAPTPANTPQILNLPSVTPSPVEDKLLISQKQMISEISDGKGQDASESEKCVVTRSLLLEFFEKSDGSDSSALTYQCGDNQSSKVKLSTDDDDESIWSIQVNASSTKDEQEEEDCFEEEVKKECDDHYNFVNEEEEEEDYDQGLLDELCAGMIKMNMNVGRKMVKFTGKHTRFVYSSDDELEGVE
ncbi:Chalcone-flavanone isomerase family protein [Abeliophyllum distichum]|uniref:Chalcone-flavanone isomerase family protein n=1 Tax=Abeliophyllum distichum TaxID=126358 RepID=A0ABD1SVJ9_9LAMI